MLDGAVTLTSCSYMIQAFIHGRKVRYQMALVDTANNGLLFRLKLMHDQEKLKKDLAHEEAEAKKKITSEDIHEGFDSHVRGDSLRLSTGGC